MSNAELIFAMVVLFVGIPSMLKNWTAAALVAAYLFMQGSYYGFGLTYPLYVSFLSDCTVIAMIYCKGPACDLYPYDSWRAQLAACWLERSFWDRIVLGLFPIGWAFYFFASDAWWPLYYISLAQFLAVGMEAFEIYRRSAKADTAPDKGSSGFLFLPGRSHGTWVT